MYRDKTISMCFSCVRNPLKCKPKIVKRDDGHKIIACSGYCKKELDLIPVACKNYINHSSNGGSGV